MKSLIRSTYSRYAVILIFLLLGSLLLRIPSFYLPHNHGDQVQYLGLAMKLEKSGFSGYNLQGINLLKSEDGNYVAAFPAEESEKGSLLAGLPAYYDEPLFHKPPLFIYALMTSHKLFAKDEPYAAVSANLGNAVLFNRPGVFLSTQFYCVIVPVLFSLLLIAVTFFFGKTLFSDKAGIYAAVLLSVSPIELMTSSRIWTDDLLTFCVTTAFLLYYIAGERRNIALSFLAGIFGGLAILTKPSGNTVIMIIFAYELWKGRIFTKELFIFLLSCVLVSMPWHWQMFRTYGSVFHLPVSTQPDLLNQPWFKFVFNRPWYMYLVNPPVQTPLFFLAYAGALSIFTRCKNEQERLNRDNKMFLLIWTVFFIASFLMTKVGKELRYILPAYPAIALLSAIVLEAAEKRLSKMLGGPVGSAIVILSILLCSWWSVSIGFRHIFSNLAEIVMPL